ncbi:MAG: AAA family ATPase [Deltaproteobacteria bacterium]|nr:AAA family ATPase [Deltaproteobacteria bacterium]
MAFVNRLRELSELRAGVQDALSGRGRLFTIVGEPGIGKSSLADEAARSGADRGAGVFWGRCWEGGGAPAYWPWIQVLRGLINDADRINLAKWLSGGASEIVQIVPELRDVLPELPVPRQTSLSEPEQARFRLLISAVAFLRHAAETQPLVIVLDDLHVADSTSLMMLMALARDLRGARLMLIGTYRETEMRNSDVLSGLIAEAEREGTRLPLRGLAESDVGQLIESAAGISPAPSLVSMLEKATEGNPFFLSEILRLMAAEGQLASELVTASRRQLRIPDSVRESISRRMLPLSAESRQVLTVASVIGSEFDLAVLETASEIPRERIVELLDAPIRLELLTEAEGIFGRYIFCHALIRDALYEALPSKQRLGLHRRIADAIRDAHDAEQRPAEIAYHYCAAAPAGDVESAVEYSRRSAQVAARQLAYEEAARHLNTALEVLRFAHTEKESLRGELLLALGEAQTKAGHLAEARKTCLLAVDHARRLRQADRFARAVVTAGRSVSESGTTDRSLVALLTEALDLLGESDSAVRAQVVARLGVELYWSDRARGTQLCQQAVEIARRINDQHSLVIALWAHHLSLRNPDSLGQRLADAGEVIGIAEQLGENDFALEVRFYRISDLLESGDASAVEVELREYLRAEAELKDRFKRGLLLEGMRALLDGCLLEAEGAAQRALIAGRESGRPLALNSFLIQTGHVYWERARLQDFEPSLRDFIAQNPLITFGRCALVQCLIQAGKTREAREAFISLAANDFQSIPRDWNWLPSMFVLADVCVELGDRDYAEVLYSLLYPYASRNAVLGYVYCYGSVQFVLGRLAALLGHQEEAAQHFEAAIAANQRIGAVIWLAHSECEYAALLFTRAGEGDYAHALKLLVSANRVAQTLQLTRLQNALQVLNENVSAEELKATVDPVQAKTFEEASTYKHLQRTKGLKGEYSSGDLVSDATDLTAKAAVASIRDLATDHTLERTVTILISDVEDSAKLFDKLGDLRAQEIIREHNEIVRVEVARHGGKEIKTMGDSFMVVFSSARRAVLCAISIQRAFSRYEKEHGDQPLQVRIGLHAGEPINESDDLFGKAVILAARITALARGGEILVSSLLRELTENAGDLRFDEAKEVELKGLSGFYRVYRVIW